MKAGIFDSGVGGLTVLKSILKAGLFDEIVYYGDTARVPYGVKDKQTIINFSLQALDFFAPHHIDILIIACNTASSYALEAMRAQSPVPIVGVIEPGIQALQDKITDKTASILVLATAATISSGAYQNRLQTQGYQHIQGLATGLFVPIVEEGIIDKKVLEAVMGYYFAPITTPPKAIILGCTHFPLIAPAIDTFFQHQSILIHSGDAIITHLQNNYHITPHKEKIQTKINFYASGNPLALEQTAQKWLYNL
ncbi:glutamate racemase [Helicobacter sp. 12S02634-8]|uniref:glutamate racemase n=1 Tax=Helicobacter sp. 12S02634-8 TaxID=1476199 RepID=UPI000BA5AAED|nr:glutamate racemase [Helicobacter sp. 12S02634-8]PAF48171.1 glutamate racemase [Helicobacter sp. 12S02634-8]